MSTRESLQTLRSDAADTRRDLEKTISQVGQAVRQAGRTVQNARARFDPMRAVASHPYAAGAAAMMVGAFLGFRGRSSKEFLAPAARALIVSAAASAFWAALNR
jgi:type VI protein secretion system component VasF